MDAKVGDWVVTPRRGKAVELNALWYNALCLTQSWTAQYGGGETLDLAGHAERARESFNRRFWYEKGGYLYDVVDVIGGEGGDDTSCRPNQLFAVSLPHPVLDRDKWEPVMTVVRERLLTRRACDRWRPANRTTNRGTTAICARATRPTIRARSGRG